MKRPLQGQYIPQVIEGEQVDAFIPNPLPPDPPVRVTADLTMLFDEALLALGQLNGVLATLEDRTSIALHLGRLESVLSCQIEDTKASLSDMLYHDMGCPSYTSLPDAQEVVRYYAAQQWGFEQLAKGELITADFIRTLQYQLTHTAKGVAEKGNFREGGYWVRGERPSHAAYIPAPASELQRLMDEWDAFVHSTCGTFPVLPKVGLAHMQFQAISPFYEGNGRVARSLVGLILREGRMLREPVLLLSYYLYRHRETYYQLLHNVPKTGDWELWLSFFGQAVKEGADHAAKIAQEIQTVLATDRAAVGSSRQSPSLLQVLRELARQPITTSALLGETTGLMPMTVNKALSHLMELGILRELTGQRRYRIYCYTALFEILNRGTGLDSPH